MSSARPLLIIIDDDPLIADTLHFVLSNEFEVCVADSRAQARSLLRQLETAPQLALVDLGLPPTPHRPDEGFKMIGELLAHSPTIKILVLSGQNDEANTRHALALGAVEFVAKPCDVERLRQLLRNALRLQTAEIGEQRGDQDVCGLLGSSLAMENLRTQINQFADAPFPVLIEGESGSGKELVASCLHRLSKRQERPYLSLNCAAISPALAESILFGHGKGAFTGAAGAHTGYFEDAADGTLFLDEIGELPLELQAKLLRVLENGEYQRVGETQSRQSRARIVAATNRDLKEEVHAGRFRIDLYHRLSVFTMHVPPLRDMDEDSLLLLDYFRNFYAQETGQPSFKLDEQARKRWAGYHFPGNVRELRNITIRLTAKYPGKTVSEAQLVAELDLMQLGGSATTIPSVFDAEAAHDFAYSRLQQQGRVDLDQVLTAWEKAYVEAALKITHGNLSQASKMLGINRTTLYSRMQLFES
ncbi:MAG TPA: sigma-54 dependent transcriptional regulator [Methylophilaceae bacterium]|nr:sigma-54 dependent transcriptional regulator [Methylophilaceae bacterium]